MADLDPLAVVEEFKREQTRADVTRAADTIKLEQDTRMMRNIVNENANPHPVLIAVLIAGVLLSAWFLYLLLVAPDASGLWVDDLGGRWHFEHDVFGKLTTTYNGHLVPSSMSDNMFKSRNLLGIWNYSNVIILVDGGNLSRIVN